LAFYTYILASRCNGTLYAGSTDDLIRRIAEHRDKLRPGFTRKYGVAMLVWYEVHETRDAAFRRERQIKEWKRVLETRTAGARESRVARSLAGPAWLTSQPRKNWVPAFAGMSGRV
jgi:putative endonuclease